MEREKCNIKITKDYYLFTDKYNWIIAKKEVEKDENGENIETFKDKTFYPNPIIALESFKNMMLINSGVKTFNKLKETDKKLFKKIEEVKQELEKNKLIK